MIPPVIIKTLEPYKVLSSMLEAGLSVNVTETISVFCVAVVKGKTNNSESLTLEIVLLP